MESWGSILLNLYPITSLLEAGLISHLFFLPIHYSTRILTSITCKTYSNKLQTHTRPSPKNPFYFTQGGLCTKSLSLPSQATKADYFL